MTIFPVLLSGGSGTRLWPLSRRSFPKQFVCLTGEESLFQSAARRLTGEGFAAPIVVTGDDFRFIVLEQFAAVRVQPQSVLIEPEGRNTAPAVLAAALSVAARDPQAPMLVAPSDHVVPDGAAFRAAVRAAVPRALAGDLVTFGIAPARAETGYGYLELLPDADVRAVAPQKLVRFVEKPDAALAAAMIAAGNYLWNSGVFLFTAEALIEAFRRHAPEILEPVARAVAEAASDLAFTRLAADPWRRAPDISIDYAIMEKARNLAVMAYSGGWSDLGGWDAVWRHGPQDAAGNVCSDHATAIDCSDTLLRSESDRMELVGIGLRDIIAVATADAVLVARRSDDQRVAEAVSALKARGAAQAAAFRTDHRPWGMFESLAMGPRFQVKRIVVKPGGALSLQSHHHRSEHWIVVEGTAQVTIGEEVKLVTENQSVYVPRGTRHRMANPGSVPMILIEVQTGAYLGEDDIVRYEDVYARGQGARG